MNRFNDLFNLSLEELLDSEYRFHVNRTRSVVTFDGSEFSDNFVPDHVDIYAMYNDIHRRPVVVSIIDVEGDKLPLLNYDKYKISYISPSGDSITYIRYDALNILSEEDIKAMEAGFNAEIE